MARLGLRAATGHIEKVGSPAAAAAGAGNGLTQANFNTLYGQDMHPVLEGASVHGGAAGRVLLAEVQGAAPVFQEAQLQASQAADALAAAAYTAFNYAGGIAG